MIRITKLTDYGFILLTYLAQKGWQRTFNARDLATEVDLPLPMVGKILKLLAREGLLTSQRGVKGGYSLSRPPEQISFSQVISALEGPVALTECSHTSHDNCDRELLCSMSAHWQRINLALHEVLDQLTLTELTPPPAPGRKLMAPPPIIN